MGRLGTYCLLLIGILVLGCILSTFTGEGIMVCFTYVMVALQTYMMFFRKED